MKNLPASSLALILLVTGPSLAQKINRKSGERFFQFSLAPGLGTNGLHPAGFSNYFSLNLTSGVSNASLFMEVGGISNLNENKTRGLQVAGLVNLTGANAFAGLSQKEREEKVRKGFEANLTGLQISGLSNVVITNSFGGQLTGGVNVTKGGLMGLQLAGLSNVVNKYSFGVQVAGLFNVSQESMDGVQVAALSNYTKGGLYGLQIGAINNAGSIDGKNSADNDDPTGVQIGLFNKSKKMNGFQIGLINVGGRMQGTQIGLINLYRNGKDPVTRDGTAIGLLNFGDVGYVSVYTNELFALNYEFATGNRKNGRMTDNKNIYIENSITYSSSAWASAANIKWSLGYGLKKMIFNRTTTPGMTEYRFVSYGADFSYINHGGKEVTNELSLLSRIRLMAGTKIHPKVGVYFFGAITLNGYWNDNGQSLAPSYMNAKPNMSSNVFETWPGFIAGVMIH